MGFRLRLGLGLRQIEVMMAECIEVDLEQKERG